MIPTKIGSTRSRWQMVMASIFVAVSVLLTVGPVSAGDSSGDALYADGFKNLHRFSSKADFLEKVANSNSIWLIQFYAPWDDYEFECEACMSLAPVFNEAANLLSGVVQFGVVDAATKGQFGRNLAFRYFEKEVDIISGYPKILLFGYNKKNPSVYRDDTDTSRPIVSYALNQIGELITRRAAEADNTDIDPDEVETDGEDVFDLEIFTEDNPVIIITEDTFSDTMKFSENKVHMLAFVAPWDIHSKKLLPHFAKASHLLKNSGATLAIMDATNNSKFVKQFKINSYPTILALSVTPSETDEGEISLSMQEFEGGHSASEISSYAYGAVEKIDATPGILQLTSELVLQDTCVIYDEATDVPVLCVITVLPPISKTKAKGRNKYLSSIQKVKKRFQGEFIQFMWIESSSQPDLEYVFDLSALPHPATMMINIRDSKYMVQPIAKGDFSATNLLRFVKSCLTKNKTFKPLDMDEIPAIYDTEAWNGLDEDTPVVADGEPPSEEEAKDEL